MDDGDGSEPGKKGYGRPPIEHQFPPKTSGNYKGRPRVKKAQKTGWGTLPGLDKMVGDLLDGRQFDGGPAVIETLLKSMLVDSFKHDSAARNTLLRIYREGSKNEEELRRSAAILKFSREHEFEMARRMGRPPPPLVPHPDHIRLFPVLLILGPCTLLGQRIWEALKYLARLTKQNMMDSAKTAKANPGNGRLADRAHGDFLIFRRVRKMVPKGWDPWEKVETCDSDPVRVFEDTYGQTVPAEHAKAIREWAHKEGYYTIRRPRRAKRAAPVMEVQ